MLILRRRNNQKIQIGKDITIEVYDIGEGSCKVAIDAPPDIEIWRCEILEQQTKNNKPLIHNNND